ncbi:MAG: ABC transporter permease [Actinomycetota bacterium]
MIPRLWRHRALFMTMVRRQYQLRYRQSFVGFAWALVPPLATLLVGTVLFRGVFRVRTGENPYILTTMAALVPWTFFANSISVGIPSVIGSISMVTRLSFPRAVLPLSAVGLSFIDFLVAGVGFVSLAFIQGDGLPLTSLWVLVLLLVEIPLVVGVVLLGSAMNVFARDIRLAVPLLVQFWLFLTPVMYPLSEVTNPMLRSFYLANPMTGIVESFRRALLDGLPPDVGMLVPALIGAGAALLVGLWYFQSTEPRFADVI